MKRILLLLSLIVFLSMFNSTSAAEIRLFGRAGATYEKGVVLSNKDIRAKIIILDEHANIVNIIDSEVD